jgi:hypothetical protein
MYAIHFGKACKAAEKNRQTYEHMIKKIALLFFSTAVSFSVAIIVLEFVYLSGTVDFYRPELVAFNPEHDLAEDENRETILFMGDSFTAGNMNYPNILRTMSPRYRIINSGVSGTGIVQAEVMAKKRADRFSPKIFVYQIYIGNDLFDIRYPVNWDRISLARNIYWFIANRIRAVAYINYRLGQISTSGDEHYNKYAVPSSPYEENEVFDVKKFTERDKIYNAADSSLIHDTILVEGKRAKDFALLVRTLQKVFGFLPEDCKKVIVVIPHMAQLNEIYLERAMQLGARFDNPKKIADVEYPFITELTEHFRDVTVLNALIPLRKAEEKGVHVYYTNDSHLNANGQKVLADSVADLL